MSLDKPQRMPRVFNFKTDCDQLYILQRSLEDVYRHTSEDSHKFNCVEGLLNQVNKHIERIDMVANSNLYY